MDVAAHRKNVIQGGVWHLGLMYHLNKGWRNTEGDFQESKGLSRNINALSGQVGDVMAL